MLAEAKKRLVGMGFSSEQAESVCFMPKDRALKFASDDLGRFMKPLLSDFDVLFETDELRSCGKKEGPEHRPSGVGRSGRRVGAGREGVPERPFSRPACTAFSVGHLLCPADAKHRQLLRFTPSRTSIRLWVQSWCRACFRPPP